MRSRNIQIPIRLSDDEYSALMKKVKACGCSREQYIRNLINGYSPKEAPPVDYYTLLSKLSRESANLNQLLVVARARGFVDAPKLKGLMTEIRTTNAMLWDAFTEKKDGGN